MNFNNEIIKQHKMISFLICNNNLITFYKKFDWVHIKKNDLLILDYSFDSNGMVFNYGNLKRNKTKYLFYINK